MPIKPFPFALGALAVACHIHAAGAAPAASRPPDSPYRLHMANAQDFRLRATPQDEYRLAKPYRRAEPEKAPEPDPVAAAIAAAARAEMEAKPFARQIDSAARAADLDPALVHALIYVESRHQSRAVSVKGAVGLMQVLPDTALRYGIHNPMRTEQNLKAGTRYLRGLINQFDDRIDLALAAYNAGEGAVLSHANQIPPYRETRDYVKAVMAKYAEWRSPASVALPLPYGGLTTVPPVGTAPPLAAGTGAPTLIAYENQPSRLKVLP
ncbi:MAG: hypothetical protein JWN73_4883 [Betaproteobacteria bacterium]|nr:hypothetical protein [Betaproteobacteria bacterium]